MHVLGEIVWIQFYLSTEQMKLSIRNVHPEIDEFWKYYCYLEQDVIRHPLKMPISMKMIYIFEISK